MNTNMILLVSISFFTGLLNFWTTDTKTETSEPLIPAQTTMCESEFDLDEYGLQKINTLILPNVAGGRWDDDNTWVGNNVPGPNDEVLIPQGTTVQLHGANQAKGITVKGTLTFDDTEPDFNLETEWLVINAMNALVEIGTEDDPYTGIGSITLMGDYDGDDEVTNCGDKVICVKKGTLQIHGTETMSWTQLGENAIVTNKYITLKESVNWADNSEIVIASSRKNWEEAERHTIDYKSNGNKTLHLEDELQFPHLGTNPITYNRPNPYKDWIADLRAEVGLLTRNIAIRGEGLSSEDGYGGHIMIHYNGTAKVSGVQLDSMGQKGLLGRYPFHWHMLRQKGEGQYIKNSSVHNSFNRAITIHGTEYALVENNFCFDHIGHGIFLEDGVERFDTIRRNVVLYTRRPEDGEELTLSDNQFDRPQDRSPASYWITNPNNVFENNVAAGTHGTGFWFAFPTTPMGESADVAYFNGLEPHKQPLGLFKGNKAHSCKNGFDIFDRLNADHEIVSNWGWPESSDHVMDSCIWYANKTAIYAGIGVGGPTENVIYRNNVFVEN